MLGLHESMLGLHESMLGLRESMLGLRESMLGLRESMLGLHESMLGLRESMLGLQGCAAPAGIAGQLYPPPPTHFAYSGHANAAKGPRTVEGLELHAGNEALA